MIFAQILSALGALCQALAAFSSHKTLMLKWQMADYVFAAIANAMLGGYTGMVSICIAFIRNGLIISKKDSLPRTLTLVALQVAIGLWINQLGWIGLLPLLSSVSYTLATFLTHKVQILRLIIIENMVLWFTYDMLIQAYPAALMDVVLTVTTTYAIYRQWQKEKLDKQKSSFG